MEHCLLLMKPDGVELSLTGEVLIHMEREDIFIAGMKAVEVTYDLAAAHYYEHHEKPFYEDVIKYLRGGYHSFPWVYAFAFCGESACQKIRGIVGKTNPMEIEHGKKIITLRQKYGKNVVVKNGNGHDLIDSNGNAVVRFENVVHASFSDAAEYEIKLWFSPSELLSQFRLYPVKEDDHGHLVWDKPYTEIKRILFPG